MDPKRVAGFGQALKKKQDCSRPRGTQDQQIRTLEAVCAPMVPGPWQT